MGNGGYGPSGGGGGGGGGGMFGGGAGGGGGGGGGHKVISEQRSYAVDVIIESNSVFPLGIGEKLLNVVY